MKHKDIWQNNSAATAIEYGLIIALIALAALGALQALGQGTGGMWNGIAEKVSAALSGI